MSSGMSTSKMSKSAQSINRSNVFSNTSSSTPNEEVINVLQNSGALGSSRSKSGLVRSSNSGLSAYRNNFEEDDVTSKMSALGSGVRSNVGGIPIVEMPGTVSGDSVVRSNSGDAMHLKYKVEENIPEAFERVSSSEEMKTSPSKMRSSPLSRTSPSRVSSQRASPPRSDSRSNVEAPRSVFDSYSARRSPVKTEVEVEEPRSVFSSTSRTQSNRSPIKTEEPRSVFSSTSPTKIPNRTFTSNKEVEDELPSANKYKNRSSTNVNTPMPLPSSFDVESTDKGILESDVVTTKTFDIPGGVETITTETKVFTEPINRTENLPKDSRSFKSASKSIKGDSLDEFLLLNGLVVLETISIGKEDNKIPFIKAYNSAGDILFIRLDKPGSLTFTMDNNTTVDIIQGSSIPKSLKVSAAACAGNAVCGVAFQCGNEYCILNRSDSGEINETNFSIVSEVNVKNILPFGSPIAFPIVNLSEIETDNQAAMLRVRKATDSIQKEALLRVYEATGVAIREAEMLVKNIKNLQMAYDKFIFAVDTEVQTYLKLDDQYRLMKNNADLAGTTLDPINQEKYKEVVSRLFNLNHAKTQTIAFMSSYNNIYHELSSQGLRTKKEFYNLFLESNRILNDDPVSKKVKDAEYWNLPKEFKTLSRDEILSGIYPDSITKTSEVKIVSSLATNSL
jgi:hypothetical protein